MRQQVVILGQSIALNFDQVSGSANPDVPEWILVLPEGVNRIEDGDPLLMDSEAASHVLKGFADTGHDMVIDYEHQTMGEGVAPAAGWIKQLEWRGDGDKPGLWAKVDWTAKAASHIQAKEYRYHSPVLIRRPADGRVVRLHNVALTNQPRLKDAPALAAKYTLNLHEEGDEDMKNFEALKKLLGLEDSADEAVVLKAVSDLKAGKTKAEGDLVALKQTHAGGEVVACKEVLLALGLSEGVDKPKVLGAVEALKAPASASAELAKNVEQLKSELTDIKAEGLIEQALKSGRTSPAEVDAWGRKMAVDQPEMFKTVVLSRPEGSVVPLKSVTLAKDDPAAGVLTDDQRKINEQLGITDEIYLKHNPKKAEAC